MSWLGLFVNLTQSQVTWEETVSVETSLRSDWPVARVYKELP